MKHTLSLGLVGGALVLVACGGPATPASTTPGNQAEAIDWGTELEGTRWSENCPKGNPEQTTLELRADRTFAFLYPDEDWRHDGNDTWAVEGTTLVVSWNDGYAVSRYALVAGDRLDGTTTKSCGDGIFLQRAR
ncbi:MAG: hypothetical protein R2939_02125 [Kofleriaceae bacterium]